MGKVGPVACPGREGRARRHDTRGPDRTDRRGQDGRDWTRDDWTRSGDATMRRCDDATNATMRWVRSQATLGASHRSSRTGAGRRWEVAVPLNARPDPSPYRQVRRRRMGGVGKCDTDGDGRRGLKRRGSSGEDPDAHGEAQPNREVVATTGGVDGAVEMGKQRLSAARHQLSSSDRDDTWTGEEAPVGTVRLLHCTSARRLGAGSRE
ncbi:hypothetical protein MRB53_039704 [Persea americana]|nr:hypothetical protein MRB53_039704 [Persea americana]